MNVCTADRDRCEPIAMPRQILSFGEAVVLADVAEKQETVRKDIETGVIPAGHVVRRFRDSRLGFPWSYPFTLAAVYGNDHLSKDLRRLALELVCEVTTHWRACNVISTNCDSQWDCIIDFANAAACRNVPEPVTVQIGKFLAIDMMQVCTDVKPRVNTYAGGLNRIECRKGVLGGEPVFKGTRLPVKHVGGMFAAGESPASIRDDYPYLSDTDVKFAHLYFKAHPPVGRPRKSGEVEGVGVDIG